MEVHVIVGYPFHQTRDVMANPRVDLRDGPRAKPEGHPEGQPEDLP